MYDRHEVFQITAPANTPKTAPVEVACHFDPATVGLIRLRIPRGHASLTGIQLAVAHQPVIPRTAGAFILGDSDSHDIPVRNLPNSGAWSAFVYNTDNRAHYWQLIFYLREIAHERSRRRTPPPALDVAEIYTRAGRPV